MRIRQLLIGGLACFFSLSLVWAAEFQDTQIRGPKNASGEYSGAVYGPIESSDTLWRIAQRYRQNPDLSIYQVMVAIYQLNPAAFENENLNLMVDGAMLKLPSERYIARLDKEYARQKAAQDDAALAQARPAGQAPTPQNLKPVQKGASTEELSQTRQAIEQQIANLDRENRNQFDMLRQQIAASIESVQSLLDENNQVLDRLDAVNQDIEALRESQNQDQERLQSLLVQQNELVDFSRQIKARQEQEARQSWLESPATLIAAGVIPALLLLSGLVFWLRRRQPAEPSAGKQAVPRDVPPPPADNEMDDLSDALTDELSGDLDDDSQDDDLFGEELLDDVLTDELEESLDAALEKELEDFDDLADEMLVPEEKEEKPEQGSATLKQDELDDLFAEDDELMNEVMDLDDGGGSDDAIDLSEVDEPATKPASQAADDDWDDELDAMLEENVGLGKDEQEKPEISIDELLDEPMAAESSEEDDGFRVDKLSASESLSDELIEQLDQEIATQGKQLDELTDELLAELEEADNIQDDLADELLAELEEEQQDADQQQERNAAELDELSDDLLSELEAAGDEPDAPQAQAEDTGSDAPADKPVDMDDIDALLEQEQATPSSLKDESLSALESKTEQQPEAEDVRPSDKDDEPAEEQQKDEWDQKTATPPEQADENKQQDMDEDEQESFALERDLTGDETGLPEDTLVEDELIEESRSDETDETDELEQSLLEGDDRHQDEEEFPQDESPETELDEMLDDEDLERALADLDDEDLSDDEEELKKDLDELPGLGDWLENKESDKSGAEASDAEIMDELASSDFDEMLESIEQEDEPDTELDLESLLNEHLEDPEPPEPLAQSEDDFLDIDALLNESVEAEEDRSGDKDLHLDVDLEEYSGVKDDEDLVDVDKDSGLNAKLDLARAYLEMDDKESAIELLQEVVQKGSEEQQEEAKGILDTLL
ncbi:FimV/HubP family polar landmark protein [Bowmanella dokdonensis]|uniref:LysM domain-containing protein n=1 Tax=Bowmanella dokdonensis TaxID=751969 RepID=A0A939DRS0_9ALTE|nr:FimV/HubP family polar landmark protein [Bowmanella dokdonensis]MBN7826706.1 hypothetical protein [Bowmanella dokdonensis]